MIVYTIIMSFSLLITTIMMNIIAKQKNKTQMQQIFLINIILLFVLCFFVLMQLLFSEPLNLDPIYFDYFAYIGGCFIPVSMFLTSVIFFNTKITLKKHYLLLTIIPIISLLMLWTNNSHHLFFEQYSVYIKQVVFGPFFYIHTCYSYALLLLAIIIFIRGSVKNSGFFSVQSFLILMGIIFPLAINILGTFGLIDITIYITPITFLFAMVFFALSIFKFNFLNINPIALQKIVNRISDGYIILNDENIITDYNKTFIKMFNLENHTIRNLHISQLLNISSDTRKQKNIFINKIAEIHKNDSEFKTKIYFTNFKKYFKIEINNIKTKNNILGTLILFKDITQHEEDMKIIQNNQEILVEQERLASLGQMISGIAHNLKTPIMSIGGAAEGINDLITEYKLSIKDKDITIEDHEQIADDMAEWVNKIKIHISYMSDIITAVKGQAVTLSQSNETSFTMEELSKRIDILMKHELKNAIVYLNITNNVKNSIQLKGNINGLVQVVNNIISNAIQAYHNEPEQNIDLIFNNIDDKIVIAIRDYAGGIPKDIQTKLFNSMITTKGKNGTGLGLFMSYSNIKAHFGGNITFETKLNKGTTFYITLPINRGKN